MAAEHLIGVDLGTSVVKATLFDLAGHALADATRDTVLHQPGPGLAEQNADDFHQAALDTIREVVEKSHVRPGSVAAIAFDGQMAGAMGIDRGWNALTPWYPSSLDTRYQPYLARMQARAGARLMELNGALPFMAPRMLWWQAEYSALFQRIHKVVTLANFVAGRLAGITGDDAFVDPSYLGWIGLSDTANHAWSSELADMFGLPLSKLPHIVSPSTIIGHLTQQAAIHCGLTGGVPLVAGTGDQVSSCLGAGLVRPGQLIDVAGTFSALATCVDCYIADTRFGMLQTLAGPLPDAPWYPMNYIGGGGLTHRWFRDQFGAEEKVQAQTQGISAYQLLDAEAAELPPGSEGLLFIPHLAGRACPSDPAVRGSWVGFTWTHKKAHFYRALLEAMAYDYAEALAAVRSYCPEVTLSEVRVIGGGASCSLWNQIKADVLGLPYVRLQRADVATLGCAIIGGHAVGIYSDMAEAAAAFAQTAGCCGPRTAYHQHYQDYIAAYHQAFEQFRGLYQVLTPLGVRHFDAGQTDK